MEILAYTDQRFQEVQKYPQPTPKLPRYIELAIEHGCWDRKLSLEVDRAILQADNYYELEFKAGRVA